MKRNPVAVEARYDGRPLSCRQLRKEQVINSERRHDSIQQFLGNVGGRSAHVLEELVVTLVDISNVLDQQQELMIMATEEANVAGKEERPQHSPLLSPDVVLQIAEYVKLKDEQVARIDFRDHLIYHYLIVVGAIAAWGLSHPSHPFVFLIIPWASLVMGWTYLFNDNRVTEIGSYILKDMSRGLATSAGAFGWEKAHRNDPGRTTRKVWQFLVDQFTFVVSGFLALGLFLLASRPLPEGHAQLAHGSELVVFPESVRWAVVGIEAVLLVVLAVQFYLYAEFGPDPARPKGGS